MRIAVDIRALRDQLVDALRAEAEQFDDENPGAGAFDTLEWLLEGSPADPNFLERNVAETAECVRNLIEANPAAPMPDVVTRAIAEQCVDFIEAIREAIDDECGP